MRCSIAAVVCLEFSVGAAILAGCGQTPYRVFAMRVAGPPPDPYATPTQAAPPPHRAGPAPERASAALAAGHPRWDLNRTPAATLGRLPGISAATLAALIAARPYRAKRDLVRRKILTPEQYARWKAYLVVHRTTKSSDN